MLSKMNDNSILYVQIWAHRLQISHRKKGITFDEDASLIVTTDSKGQEIVACIGDAVRNYISTTKYTIIKPFSHPRSLISDFYAAEKILQHAVKTSLSGEFLALSPLIIIHPMEKLEGGLTQVEKRAFQELAQGAGARECIVHEGNEINLSTYHFKSEKPKPHKEASSMAHRILIFSVIVIVTAIMFSPILLDLIS